MGVKISGLTAKGAALATTDLIEISQDAGGGLYTTRSVTGANIKALVTDANMTTSDITTNDVSTAKHGFAPKAPNDTAKFLRGDGTWAVPASGGLTEFTELETTAAPNATVPVNSLTPVTATTNADFALIPKGNGALLTKIPDGAGTGGNKRGQYAVDLQLFTNFNTRVASGNYSAIIGGEGNTSSGTHSLSSGGYSVASGNYSVALGASTSSSTYSLAVGQSSTASADGAVALGRSNTSSGARSFSSNHLNVASGTESVALGNSSTAAGDYCMATGLEANTSTIRARRSHGNGSDSQASKFMLKRATTNNTLTYITTDGNDEFQGGATNMFLLANNSGFRFKGTIIGKQSGSTNVAAWDIDGLVVRGANAAATTLLISNVTLVQNTPAWGTPTLAANTTRGGVSVSVTGASATNIKWTAVIETAEVIYA